MEETPSIPPHPLEERRGNFLAPFILKQKVVFSRPPLLSAFIQEKPCVFFVRVVYYLQSLGSFVKSRKVDDQAIILEWGPWDGIWWGTNIQ